MAPVDRRVFENLHPGRRIVFDLPVSDYEMVRFVVLDSSTEWDEVACAAMVVPTGAEDDWMYSSEGGQWQLLATAGVSRMIVVERVMLVEGFGVREGVTCLQCEDEALKTKLSSTVVALAPRICFRSGIPIVPFVDYTNNVIHRVVVEESYSSLTGLMVVEDIALDDSDTELLESESFDEGEKTECAHRIDSRRGRRLDRVSYRRRLRFQRMPNLIQTEVPLVIPQNLRTTIAREIDKESVVAYCEEVMSGSQIDHSFLVHKYLPPIVAGLVLAASCIEPCMERGERAKVLALGVGGGALPIFLQKHLGFHVQAVDVDRVVLDLAHRHFGLKNGVDMEVEEGDALQIVGELAMKISAEDALLNSADASPKSMKGSFGSSISAAEGEDDLAPPCSTQTVVAASFSSVDCIHDVCQVNESKRGFNDHRVHVIVVDVDEGDARCGLSSPPSSFLEHSFLSAARTVLYDGGLLAMNVVPNRANSYCGVVSSLLSVFDDVYETTVEGDVNRVVFALPSKSAGLKLDGPLASLVKRFLDVRLISGIQKPHNQS